MDGKAFYLTLFSCFRHTDALSTAMPHLAWHGHFTYLGVVLHRQIKLSAILRQIEFVSQFHVPLKMHIGSIGILIEMTFPELLDVGCSVVLTILMPSLPNVRPFISRGNCISIKHISQCCFPGHRFPFHISIMEQVNTVHLHLGTLMCKRKLLYLTQATLAIEIQTIKSTFWGMSFLYNCSSSSHLILCVCLCLSSSQL